MGVISTPHTQTEIQQTGAESDNSTDADDAASAFAELCKKQLPVALALGMSAEEFWHGDVGLFWAYVRAGEIKRKQEDYAAWAQGYYFQLALSDVMGQVFAQKGHKPKRVYPEKPIFTAEREKKPKAKAQDPQKAAYAAAIAQFMRMNDATNAAVIAKNNTE